MSLFYLYHLIETVSSKSMNPGNTVVKTFPIYLKLNIMS